MTKAYIFDLDGTLADLSHRLHFIQQEKPDWDAFFAACSGDAVIEHVAELARALWESQSTIVFVSGRSDSSRNATVQWLRDNDLDIWVSLYMRKEGDHRPDYIVKKELLGLLRAEGFEPIMAFDDRDQVVKMWREEGVPCAQVAEGNF